MKLSGVSFVLEHAQNFMLNLVLVPVLVRKYRALYYNTN